MCKNVNVGPQAQLTQPAQVQAYFVCKGDVFDGWLVMVLLAWKQLLPGGLAPLWDCNLNTFSFDRKRDHSLKKCNSYFLVTFAKVIIFILFLIFTFGILSALASQLLCQVGNQDLTDVGGDGCRRESRAHSITS